ncbi:MAG TPA: hypothetical protein VMW06_03300 [Desulfobacterales bacterium]|nr:hypothetical protein [Desulfobacterales bacterium]
MKKQLNFILILSLLFAMAACTKQQLVLQPDQEKDRAYYEALSTFNQADRQFTQALVKYNTWCEKPEYTAACTKTDPYWHKANTVLSTWEEIVESRKQDTTAQGNYRDALKALKSKVLMELPNYQW